MAKWPGVAAKRQADKPKRLVRSHNCLFRSESGGGR